MSMQNSHDVPRMAAVVVADDEVHVVDLLAILLEEHNVTVVKSYNGEQALSAIRQHRPRLVICNAMMPRLGGVALIRRLKEDAETATIPVVLMTSLPSWEVPANDAVSFLAKPFDLDEVEALARRYLHSRK